MGKKSKAKAGGDFWDEDPDLAPEQAQPIEDDDFSGEEEDSKAPQEANDDEWDDGLLGALKRNKKKKDKKDEEAEAKRKEEAANEGGVQVKSKKEKEKEKKEREKAKKKAAAARKAASAPQPSKKKDTSAEAEEDADADADASAPSPAEVAAAAAKGGKKGKKGKLNPALAAIQKQQAAKAAAEEAAREKLEADRLAAEEEEARLIAEEEAEEEARRVKREKKKAKEEELKKQGKFLTKKQREQQTMLARRREQLLASGVQVAGLKKDQTEIDTSSSVSEVAEQKEKERKQREAAEAERKKKEEAEAKKKAEAEAEAKKKAEAEKAAAGGSDDDALLSDWEAGLEDSDEDSKSEAEKDESSTPEPETAKSSGTQKTNNASAASKGDAEEIDINSLRIDDKKRAAVDAKREERHAKAVASASQKDLRSPICAILGHVDTGKTKLLDNMRKTNVQEGEAGGITQQIGATYFPIDMIEKKADSMKNYVDPNFNVPGLLIIDTPGHESFTNLRSRGSSLCNIAILVVDIMHGFQQQTMESIRLLKDRKTPFVVALNKVDRIYGWESTPNQNIRDSLASQNESVRRQFEDRVEATKLLFAEQGFNSELYYKNKNLSKYVSIVPTSAVSGEGVPDLLYLLLELTTSRMSKQLMYLSELEATILEVKVIEGLGTTIDVVLSNGVLHEGDRIVLCGSNGPIATNVRALLTPQPARELRIKSQYVHHKEVKAALGVKISANDLEHAIAGSRLLLVGPDDDEDELMDDVMEDMSGLLDLVDKSGEGVCVQASTLGSLEALLDFLKDMKIPVMSIGLGPVHKRDVMRSTTMLERKPEFAIMLCFDVKVEKDAELYANENNIKIFTADIIYHLFDDFQRYQAQMLEQRRQEKVKDAVFPAVLSIIQVINKRAPMIIGVDIVEGSLRIGTPIAIVKADSNTGMKLVYPLGRVQSMEVEHKSRDEVRKGQAKGGIAIRLDSGNMTNMPTWGRHISENDQMYSLISRKSIDTLKDPAFRDSVPREDWILIKKLKPLFDIH